MSEEIKEREEFIKIVGILSFSDAHPSDCKYITNFIIDLAKENQQLSNELRIKNEELRIKGNVLNEIREYIKNHSIYFATREKVGNYFANCSCDELLKILDKVKE